MDTATWKADSMNDAILDGIDFKDIALVLQTSYPRKQWNKQLIHKIFKEELATRMQDAEYILDNNIDFILKEAMKP